MEKKEIELILTKQAAIYPKFADVQDLNGIFYLLEKNYQKAKKYFIP